jgi:Domain of unknown function (DUF4397)
MTSYNRKMKPGHTYNIIGISLLTFFLSSCAKQQIEINTAPQTYAAVNFVQASPDEPGLNLSFYNTQFNTSAVPYGSYSGYLAIYSGMDSVRVSNATTGAVIHLADINFTQSTPYTLFLANKPTSPEFFLLQDTLNAPTTGNASIRFVDVSPDAPAVDLVIKGGSTLVANRSYKGFSSFQSITANTIYTFEVHQAGTATVLASLSNLKLQAGVIYTVWFHGLSANTSTADQLALDYMGYATSL